MPLYGKAVWGQYKFFKDGKDRGFIKKTGFDFEAINEKWFKQRKLDFYSG